MLWYMTIVVSVRIWRVDGNEDLWRKIWFCPDFLDSNKIAKPENFFSQKIINICNMFIQMTFLNIKLV